MRITRFLSAAATACALVAAASPASAAIKVTNFSFDPWGTVGTIHAVSQGVNMNVGAGRFAVTGTDLATATPVSLQTFCIDIEHFFRTNSIYDVQNITGATLDPTRQAQLAGLLINGMDLLNASIGTPASTGISAALQLGVWELVYESGSTYDVASGNFYANGGLSGYQAQANSYLANVKSGAWTGDINRISTLISRDGSQNQVFINGVPEPGTWAMMLLGFGFIGATLRRPKKVARVNYNFA